MVDHCANPSNCNWEPIVVRSPEELPAVLRQVQALANEGEIVMVGWYNPTGPHGHVSLVMPGELQASGWGFPVCMTMETGKNNRYPSVRISRGLGPDTKETIRFFRYKGPINNK